MSPDLVTSGPVRSVADELNDAIRAFWLRPGAHPAVPLTREERDEYRRLLAELQQIRRGDVTKAA